MRNSEPLPAPLRVLVLGGTTEARLLGQALARDARIAPILSLAGRTRDPARAAIPTRVGGFGGREGLARYLFDTRIDVVVDATHPFAARISVNAHAACERQRVPLAVFTRPAWEPGEGDRWTFVPDITAAAAALGQAPRRVFLTTGRLELAAFRAAPQHQYLVRTIDLPETDDLPSHHRVILARGPFAVADEIALMRETRAEVLVSKNSGGAASFGKIAAARDLGLPVVMIERPPGGAGAMFTALADVLGWIETHRAMP